MQESGLNWGIGAGGVGLSILSLFVQLRWPHMPHWLSNIGIATGLLLLFIWTLTITWGKGMGPVWLMGSLSALLAAGALFYYFTHRSNASAEHTAPELVETILQSPPRTEPSGQEQKESNVGMTSSHDSAIGGPGGQDGMGARGMDSGSRGVTPNADALEDISRNESHNVMGPIHGNQGIITQGQVGDNTIIQAPSPKYRVIQHETVKANSDGSVTLGTVIEVLAPSPPANLAVRTRGEGATALQVDGLGSGFMMTESGRMEEWFVEKVQSPFGRYRIRVTTTRSDVNPELEIAFNK